MICQQHNVAEDVPATITVVLPAAGLSSFFCFVAIVEVVMDFVAWVATAVASSGSF